MRGLRASAGGDGLFVVVVLSRCCSCPKIYLVSKSPFGASALANRGVVCTLSSIGVNGRLPWYTLARGAGNFPLRSHGHGGSGRQLPSPAGSLSHSYGVTRSLSTWSPTVCLYYSGLSPWTHLHASFVCTTRLSKTPGPFSRSTDVGGASTCLCANASRSWW